MPFARAEGLQRGGWGGPGGVRSSQCPSLGPRGCNLWMAKGVANVGLSVSMPFARAEGLQRLGSITSVTPWWACLNALRSGRGAATNGQLWDRWEASSQCPSLGPRGCNMTPSASRGGSCTSQCPSLGPRGCNAPAVTLSNGVRVSQCPSLGPRGCNDWIADNWMARRGLNALRSGRGAATPPLTTLSNRRQFGVFFEQFA